jgi:hypothetical protein
LGRFHPLFGKNFPVLGNQAPSYGKPFTLFRTGIIYLYKIIQQQMATEKIEKEMKRLSLAIVLLTIALIAAVIALITFIL